MVLAKYFNKFLVREQPYNSLRQVRFLAMLWFTISGSMRILCLIVKRFEILQFRRGKIFANVHQSSWKVRIYPNVAITPWFQELCLKNRRMLTQSRLVAGFSDFVREDCLSGVFISIGLGLQWKYMSFLFKSDIHIS